GKSFYYNRLRQLDPGEPAPNKYLKSAVYLHQVGRDPKDDPKIAGFGMNKDIAISETDIPFISVPPESKWAFLYIAHGVQNEVTAFYAPLGKVEGSDPPWKKLVDIDDQVTSLDVHADDVYLLTHKGASRFKIAHVHLPDGSIDRANVVLPQSEMVLRD